MIPNVEAPGCPRCGSTASLQSKFLFSEDEKSRTVTGQAYYWWKCPDSKCGWVSRMVPYPDIVEYTSTIHAASR